MFPGQSYRCDICRNISEKDIHIYGSDNFTVYAHPIPFNNGHIVIALNRHVNVRDAGQHVFSEGHSILSKFIGLVRRIYNPHGINIIIEEDHLAFHVVPRWVGDVSFISLVHGFKVVPQLPRDVARSFKENV